MQIVADRDTPTRQWTSVAPPSSFPASAVSLEPFSKGAWELRALTYELEAPLKFIPEWIYTIVLHSVHSQEVITWPFHLVDGILRPRERLANAEYAGDAQFTQQLRVVGVS